MTMKRVPTAVLAACAMTLALALMPTSAAAAAWLDPVDAGQPDRPVHHDVAMTPEGEVLTIWRGGTTDNYVVRTVERPAGGSLGSPRELVAAGDIVENINLDLNEDGDAIAVWRRRDESIRLQYSVREAGGEFSIGQFGSPNGADVAQPDVALGDDGDAIVVWRRAPVPGDGYVRYATRPAGGQFGSVDAVANEGGRRPTVAVDGAGNATAIWAREELGQAQVIRAATRPKDGSFSTPSILSGEVSSLFAVPVLAVNRDGAAIAAWMREDVSGDDRIEVALRQPGGAFGAAHQISPDGVDSGIPRVAIDGQGEVIVVWENDTADTIEAAAGSVAGGLGAAETLSGPDAFGHSLAMTDEGRAAVAWSEVADPVYRVYAAVRPPGGQFGAAMPVSNPEGQALGSLVALDAEGNAVVAWRHRTEPGVFASERIRIAGYDAVPPRITSVGFPGPGPVGSPFDFSASAEDVWGPIQIDWQFGDGATATGGSVSHAYRRDGSFGASATATDAAGNASATEAATVRAVDRRVRIRILGRGVRLNRRGIAWLRLHCPASERSSPCRGRVVVRTRGRLRVGRKRRRIVLARGRFRIPAGRTRAVRLRMGRRKARLVRRNRRARRVIALAGVRDGSGNRSRARKRMRVVPLRRGGRRGGARR